MQLSLRQGEVGNLVNILNIAASLPRQWPGQAHTRAEVELELFRDWSCRYTDLTSLLHLETGGSANL